jgi:hypothetical protein
MSKNNRQAVIHILTANMHDRQLYAGKKVNHCKRYRGDLSQIYIEGSDGVATHRAISSGIDPKRYQF